MSSLRKQAAKRPTIVATPAPDDYKPQHPMHEWRPAVATAESDHLDEYTEVEPFEASEPNFISKKFAQGKAKYAQSKAKKAAAKAALDKYANIIAKKLHTSDDVIDKAVKAAVDAGISKKTLFKKVIKLTAKSERKEAKRVYKAMTKKLWQINLKIQKSSE